MSDAKSPQNLSMDEILATIRRIIAEDEQSSGIAARGVPAATSPAPASPANVSPASVSPANVPNKRAAGGARERAQVSPRAAGASDVLDLTDALTEDGSMQRPAPSSTAFGAPEPVPGPFVSAPEPARAPPLAARAAETTALDAKPADTSPTAGRPVDPGSIAPTAQPAGANDDRLISEVAALAAATAFGRLASAPRARREPPLVGGRPLDDIVREMLRPLLRTWLDENLPGIVERLIQEEIARISARSRPG